MSRTIQVAHALVSAASTFLSTLVRRPPEAAFGRAPDAPRSTLFSGSRTAGIENRCPVCQARFRGPSICPRCGADLEPLMLLAVKAWQLRQAARQALGAGDADRALQLTTEAQRVQGSERGEALRLLAAWLKTVCVC